jgi:hypothetical protein
MTFTSFFLSLGNHFKNYIFLVITIEVRECEMRNEMTWFKIVFFYINLQFRFILRIQILKYSLKLSWFMFDYTIPRVSYSKMLSWNNFFIHQCSIMANVCRETMKLALLNVLWYLQFSFFLQTWFWYVIMICKWFKTFPSCGKYTA